MFRSIVFKTFLTLGFTAFCWGAEPGSVHGGGASNKKLILAPLDRNDPRGCAKNLAIYLREYCHLAGLAQKAANSNMKEYTKIADSMDLIGRLLGAFNEQVSHENFDQDSTDKNYCARLMGSSNAEKAQVINEFQRKYFAKVGGKLKIATEHAANLKNKATNILQYAIDWPENQDPPLDLAVLAKQAQSAFDCQPLTSTYSEDDVPSPLQARVARDLKLRKASGSYDLFEISRRVLKDI